MKELGSTREFVFVDKPSGVTTHTSHGKMPRAEGADGWQEYLAERFATPLFTVHRLDRDTSGAMVFATSPETASDLSERFRTRDVDKRYWFVSRGQQLKKTEFVYRSDIRKSGKSMISSPGEGAETYFRKLASHDNFQLWEAAPRTGRTHQIRLHARDVGLTVLGDTLYGGEPFPQLCLHSRGLSLSLNGKPLQFTSPAPAWMNELDLCRDADLCRWLAGVDRRERLQRSFTELGAEPLATLRLLHDEDERITVDTLGDVIVVSWFAATPPSAKDQERINNLARICGWQKWYLQLRGNRGKNNNREEIRANDAEVPAAWQAHEGQMLFAFHRDRGLSPGLFLDQRQNREWVRRHSAGRTVLNLFCYTGGFSVASALGGASEVTSVDLNANFLNWAKENFQLNNLDLENSRSFIFRKMDARKFLTWAVKKQLSYDLVICDPPSFARTEDGVFRLEDDFTRLFASLLMVTSPGGQVLFASNFEGMSLSDFRSEAERIARVSQIAIRFTDLPSADWDFELPGQPRVMKSFCVTRELA